MPRTKRRPRRPLALFIGATLAIASSAHSAQPALDVAAADNAFGFRLLGAIQHALPNRDIVLSPVSAALGLAMVLNAATRQTRHEMLAVLALEGSDLDVINAANAQLIKEIRAPVEKVTLSVANSVWVNSRRAQLRSDYVEQMQTGYAAEIDALDFSSPGAAARLNGWASQATDGKISHVIDRVDPSGLAMLLDAVYFKGQWTQKFDPAHTRQRDFTLADGAVKQVARMAQSGRFDYVETSEMQAIRLPFGDGSLVMDVLLPSRSSSLRTLEDKLTPENWAAWRAHYMPHAGTIELPRFELKSDYLLNEALQRLGMARAFQPSGAQLAGMFEPAVGQARAGEFFISSVLQSAYWKVDEEGAEAAAVTTIGVRAAAVARPVQQFQMIVDRPFFCAIEDRRSGALLFVASIYDPAV